MRNVLTNIIGLILLACGVYGLLYLNLEIIKFAALVILSGALMYFKNSTIKRYLKKVINKYV